LALFQGGEHDREKRTDSLMSEKATANHLERHVVTIDEAAAMLRISHGSAYEAARRKEIPTIRIGRRLLVPANALERLLSGAADGHSQRQSSDEPSTTDTTDNPRCKPNGGNDDEH